MRTSDGAVLIEHAESHAQIETFEYVKLSTLWVCEKWSEEACQFVRDKIGLPDVAGVGSDLLRMLVGEAELIEERPGNLGLNEGIQMMFDLMIAAGGTTAYNNANSRIGVGDSNTAEAATQTDLQAAVNKLYKAMNATFPSRSGQTLSFQSDFLTGEANYAWQEWTVDNGAASAKNISRKVQSLGTKVSGTWTLTAQLTGA